MRRRTACVVAVALLACEKPSPTGSPAPLAPASAAPSSVPSAPPSAAPPVASSSAGPLRDAGPPVDAATLFACTLDLDAPATDIAHVPGPVLAHAIIPSLDPAHMRAKVLTSDAGMPVIRDCHGGSAQARWELVDSTKKPPADGTVKLLARQRLPDGRQAVWLGTTTYLGACAPNDGAGFLAIVALEGARVAVLGVSPWEPACGPRGALRAEKLGRETVYVETDKQGTGAGISGFEHVWTVGEGKLQVAGTYDTLNTGEAETGELGDGGLYPASITAKATFAGDEIVLHGQNTWMKPGPVDGGDRVVGKKAAWVKRYALRDGKLVEKKSR